jgi:hypothetical protein
MQGTLTLHFGAAGDETFEVEVTMFSKEKFEGHLIGERREVKNELARKEYVDVWGLLERSIELLGWLTR